jgi:LPS sulfotransferase NodH
MKEYSIEEVRKFIGKISNDSDYWFTFIINPGIEPTNNRAERAFRPHVVLRKILDTIGALPTNATFPRRDVFI